MSTSRPLDRTALRSHPLPQRGSGDKDEHGKILIVAGSRDVPGAALLTATAAMRAGAGKLKIVTTADAAGALGIAMPEAMVIGLPEDSDAGGFVHGSHVRIAELAGEADGVVAGPGLADNPECMKIAKALLEVDVPLALDAALLHALEPLTDVKRSSLPLLLPHSGELASLLDCEPKEVEREPVRSGIKAAQLYQAIVLVKGVTSHVVTPDKDVWTYTGGAPGLGVSGSGDALAGITGALLARGADPLTSLLWSVWLHGEAGAALSKRIGPIGFLAREIPGEIPALLAR